MFGRKLRAAGGAEIEVVDPGFHNLDSGPDFFNSKVKIGDTEWIGNVEIHVKASDWYRHGHHTDPAYDNIILHVVGVSDKEVLRADGTVIPQAEITFPQNFFNTLSQLSQDIDSLRCAGQLQDITSLHLSDCLESLAVERLQDKAGRVMKIMKENKGDWEQTCFTIFARSLGFGLNAEPFEMLARSLNLNTLHRHSDHPLQLQAMIFGQAGMLDPSQHIFDEYYQYLCREYYFLARKYNLRPISSALWKYARTRPQNFPHRRLAFLAKTCENGFSMFSQILAAGADIESQEEIFKTNIDSYWQSHFGFGSESTYAPATLSAGSLRLLLINTSAVILYAFGASTGDIDLAEKGVKILEQLPAENNSIIRLFTTNGITCENALRSQALLHLKKEYCDARKCLYCRLGARLLRKSASFTY